MKFSDHRPVYATFECDISTVDEKRKEEISCRLYEKLKQQPATTTTNPLSDDEEDDNEQYSIKLGLPPPSSEKRKWWLDHGEYI